MASFILDIKEDADVEGIRKRIEQDIPRNADIREIRVNFPPSNDSTWNDVVKLLFDRIRALRCEIVAFELMLPFFTALDRTINELFGLILDTFHFQELRVQNMYRIPMKFFSLLYKREYRILELMGVECETGVPDPEQYVHPHMEFLSISGLDPVYQHLHVQSIDRLIVDAYTTTSAMEAEFIQRVERVGKLEIAGDPFPIFRILLRSNCKVREIQIDGDVFGMGEMLGEILYLLNLNCHLMIFTNVDRLAADVPPENAERVMRCVSTLTLNRFQTLQVCNMEDHPARDHLLQIQNEIQSLPYGILFDLLSAKVVPRVGVESPFVGVDQDLTRFLREFLIG